SRAAVCWIVEFGAATFSVAIRISRAFVEEPHVVEQSAAAGRKDQYHQARALAPPQLSQVRPRGAAIRYRFDMALAGAWTASRAADTAHRLDLFAVCRPSLRNCVSGRIRRRRNRLVCELRGGEQTSAEATQDDPGRRTVGHLHRRHAYRR